VKLWVGGDVMLLVGPQKSCSEHNTLTPKPYTMTTLPRQQQTSRQVKEGEADAVGIVKADAKSLWRHVPFFRFDQRPSLPPLLFWDVKC